MQMMIIAGIGILITGIVLFNLEKIKKAINTKDLIKKFIYLALLFGAIELLHFLLKEKIYLEAITILSLFIAAYLIIISLFIAKKRGNFFIRHFILTFFLGVVVYNYVTYPSYTYRYRMTVEVETPEGVKTGSSVIEVRTEQWNSWMTGLSNGHNGSSEASGEGVIVMINDDNALLVLIGKGSYNDHANYMLPYAVPMKEWNVDWNKSKEIKIPWGLVKIRKVRQHYGTLKGEKGILKKELYPLCFIAKSINSENIEVKELDLDNLEKILGDGFFIKNITIETTSDPLEWKIRKSSDLLKLKDYLRTKNVPDYVFGGLSVGKME